MKKKRGIKIYFTNRWLYTFIVIGILIAIGVGVYAYGTSNPAVFGHSIGELAPPTGCASGQYLQYSGGVWVCTNIATSCPTGWTDTGTFCYSPLNSASGSPEYEERLCALNGTSLCSIGQYLIIGTSGCATYTSPYTGLCATSNDCYPGSGITVSGRWSISSTTMVDLGKTYYQGRCAYGSSYYTPYRCCKFK